MADILEMGKGKYALFLDAEEAGYLKDVMRAHVAGTLTTHNNPLARIRRALTSVPRRLAQRSGMSYVQPYAVLEPYNDDLAEAYALNALYNEGLES
jgi:hypothetical protein